MNQTAWKVGSCLAVALGLITRPVFAQSISIDGSTTTLLNGIGNCSDDCIISGGLRDGNSSGPNLFHSFSTFSVNDAKTVTFIDPGVDNIFSRVTGSTPSNIDGTIKVDGTANLFLLNPNGIVFGNNAKLDIQGSFLSSTADALTFQGDTAFSASSSAFPSLLTINVPVGLQFGTSPSPIQVQGNGHSLIYDPGTFTIERNSPTTGLTVANGQTLALLGGDIAIQGGNLTAELGRIEVGSPGDNALVKLSPSSSGWDFDYTEAPSFRDISLSQQSSLDISGDDAGSLRLQGRQIDLSGGSAILAQVLANGGGQIVLNASENISLTGVDYAPPTQQMPTGIFVEIAPGAVGDGSSRISVSTPQLSLMAGGQIGIGMAGAGNAGSVDVSARAIAANGASNIGPSTLFSGVLPVFGPSGAVGQGGNLNIKTDQLSVADGAQLIASTFGAGNAGNLTIEARTVEVIGSGQFSPSSIVSGSEVPSIPPSLTAVAMAGR